MIPPAARRRLLDWSEQTRRDLPWRRTRDPWAVLVSELMLQQTQVARVIPKYEAFLERFADPAACAAAPVGDVVTAWAGLGYNRRAVNLHRCAVVVTDQLGGRLPDDLDGLLALLERLDGAEEAAVVREALAAGYSRDRVLEELEAEVRRRLARLDER